jgi:penicillin-binding protein 2
VIDHATGAVARRFDPRVRGRLDLPPDLRQAILDGLTRVVADGEGTASDGFAGFPLDVFPVAGKTGTAEVDPGKKADTALFAAFGPASDPRYAVVAVLEEAGFGADAAVPLVRQVFEYLQDPAATTAEAAAAAAEAAAAAAAAAGAANPLPSTPTTSVTPVDDSEDADGADVEDTEDPTGGAPDTSGVTVPAEAATPPSSPPTTAAPPVPTAPPPDSIPPADPGAGPAAGVISPAGPDPPTGPGTGANGGP